MKVKRGGLIIKSKPFVYKLSVLWRGKRCDTCLEGYLSLKKCTKCKLTFYCSKECQRADWVDHKPECDKIGEPSLQKPDRPDLKVANLLDLIILLARLIQKLQRGGGQESETIGKVTRTFSDLISHSQEIRKDKRRLKVVETVHSGLKMFMGCTLSFDELLELAGKVMINSLTIIDHITNEHIGTGLYLGLSVINHSCEANALYVFNGPNCILRSIVDHEDFDIFKVFVPYIDVLELTADRQKLLLSQYYFTCTCAWCEDKAMDKRMKSLRCEKADCAEPVYIKSGECFKCGTPVNAIKRIDAEAVTEKLALSLSMAPKVEKAGRRMDAASAALTGLMKDAEPYLHPLNIMYIKGAQDAFDLCLMMKNYERALYYGLIVLQGCRAYYKDFYPKIGNLLTQIGSVQCNLGNPQEGRKKIQEALDISKALFGEDHKHTRRIRDLL